MNKIILKTIYVNESAYNFLKKSKVYPNDILMNKIANAGSVYLMPDLRMPVSLGMNLFLIRINHQLADPKYVYYYLKLNEKYVKLFATGAATSTITKEMVRRLEIKTPGIERQHAIVVIISTYNELIEINHRRIRLLEEVARLLFREWFVYFRFPAYAKASAGRSGYKKVKINDGVPEGWIKEKLKNIVSFLGGHAFKSSSYQQAGMHGIVTIKNVQQGNFIPDCADYLDETPSGMKKHCFLSNGDILISLTGNVGRVCLVFGTNYLLNQRVAKIESKNNTPKSFIYWMFDNPVMQKRIENLSYGSAQQNLSPIKLGEQTVVFPPEKLLKTFDEIVEPINSQIIQLLIQNQKLAQARDLLLPRLMSGKIEV